MSLVIGPLTKEHDRKAFDCGVESLNRFLRETAGQHDRRGLGRTFVATHEGATRVLGYYTLASSHVDFVLIPPSVKGLPRIPVPVVLLGRLAVDQTQQGTGLGRSLLLDAIRRTVLVAEQVGVSAIEVDALDEAAARFYRKFGFIPFLDSPLHLFLPLQTARALGL